MFWVLLGERMTGKTKTALLVDFDNIYSVLEASFVQGLPSWLNWLEDGAFSADGRGRQVVTRKVYWNTQFDLFREQFEARGFQAYSCRSAAAGKVRSGKSSADMILTMDAMELAGGRNKPNEIIILSADTDFLPLVNRLQTYKCRVVVAGRESDFSLGFYREHADAVIHMTGLREACSYARAKRRFFGLLPPKAPVAGIEASARPEAPKPINLPGDPKTPPAARKPVSRAAPPPRAVKKRPPPVAVARNHQFDLMSHAAVVAKLGSDMPDQPISRGKIIRALEAAPDFNMNPVSRTPTWLGEGSYTAMLAALAAVHPNLALRQYANGGATLVYRVTRSDVATTDTDMAPPASD